MTLKTTASPTSLNAESRIDKLQNTTPHCLNNRATSASPGLRLPHPPIFILVALVLLLLSTGPVFAQRTIFVGGSTAPDCSLAEAIANANAAAQTHSDCTGGSSGGNTIILLANQSAEDVASGHHTGLPAITRDLRINGGGYVISGATAFTCFTITTPGVDLSLNGVILDRCRSPSHGGAISYVKSSSAANQPRSSLALNDVVVRDSQAAGSGRGGGIYVHSTSVDFPLYVSINRSAIHGNTAAFTGGGLELGSGTIVTINNSSIYGNTAASRGGGIYASAPLPGGARFTLNHVTITGNTANQPAGDANRGGGIRIGGGTLTLRNSIIAGNTNAGTNEDCRINAAEDVTIAAMSNNIIGSGATANCPTIQVNGVAVTDPGLAPNENDVTVSGVGIVTSFYDLLETSAAINAAGNCRSITRHDQRYYYRPYPTDQGCDIGAIEFGPPRDRNEPGRSGGGGNDGGAGAGGVGGESGPAAIASCNSLAPAIVVGNAAPGTACQLVQSAGYGHPDLVAAKPASVVDVWGLVPANTQVCFQATSGSLRYVDTGAMPRTFSTLTAFSQGGMVCGSINGPGQVALIADGSAPGGQAPATAPQPAQLTPAVAAQSLSGCMVRTRFILNFRQSPGGERLHFTDPWGARIAGWLPANVNLTALARTAGWFHVDYHGTRGWISAAYVTTSGTCGG